LTFDSRTAFAIFYGVIVVADIIHAINNDDDDVDDEEIKNSQQSYSIIRKKTLSDYKVLTK